MALTITIEVSQQVVAHIKHARKFEDQIQAIRDRNEIGAISESDSGAYLQLCQAREREYAELGYVVCREAKLQRVVK